MTPNGLQITPPKDLGDSMYAWSFQIVTNKKQHHPNVIETDVKKSFEGTKKVNLDGHLK